jgi:hypothetical protein
VTELREGKTVDDLSEQYAVAATVGTIQRIAMAIVDLPKENERRAHAWLNSTMQGIETLVSEIEAGGGAVGGKA